MAERGRGPRVSIAKSRSLDRVERVSGSRRRSRGPRRLPRGRADSRRPPAPGPPVARRWRADAASENRAAIASSISTYASRWCANRTGCAGWMCVVPGKDRVAISLGETHERSLELQECAVPRGRTSAGARVAGRSRPDRCASGPYAACPRPARSAPRARPRGSGARPRRSPPSRSAIFSTSDRQALEARDQPRRPPGRSAGPARRRPRTWAIEPTMSSTANARSISTERVKSATRRSFSSLNRPAQSSHLVLLARPPIVALGGRPPALSREQAVERGRANRSGGGFEWHTLAPQYRPWC